ncbi:MAG: hypothetical protein J5803_01160, partial [Desulfovibrio sp.]|nr:hypothetical protein [Desulfovibrio sp.]
ACSSLAVRFPQEPKSLVTAHAELKTGILRLPPWWGREAGEDVKVPLPVLTGEKKERIQGIREERKSRSNIHHIFSVDTP